MNIEILTPLIILSSLIIGLLIGKHFSNIKLKSISDLHKSEINSLSEKITFFEKNKKEETINFEKKISELKNERQSYENKLSQDLNELRREKEFLNVELTKRNSEFENLKIKNEEQKSEVNEIQEKFKKEFENLANKILEEKSNRFTKQNKENIKDILNPLQERIQLFEKKVEETHKENIVTHATLKEQILGLKNLNEQMSKEAINLTRALKGDNKTQGNWGELVLERVLEKSGLEKDREYVVQKNFTREDGSRAMPDVIINLPDNKKIIVDSKVTLVAYERFVNEDDDHLKEVYLKEHISALKKHVDQLSAKNYQDLYDIESLDFVLLFVPIETAFSTAINKDNTIYNKAFEQNIVIVTPSTLLATLRTIDTMWNNEKQQRNALDIAKQAGSLYDKFEGLIKDLTSVGNKLNSTKKDYDLAMNKLVDGRGNLVSSVEKLKKMGAKAKKSIPENFLNRAQQDDTLF